jgi:hypothetical protein
MMYFNGAEPVQQTTCHESIPSFDDSTNIEHSAMPNEASGQEMQTTSVSMHNLKSHLDQLNNRMNLSGTAVYGTGDAVYANAVGNALHLGSLTPSGHSTIPNIKAHGISDKYSAEEYGQTIASTSPAASDLSEISFSASYDGHSQPPTSLSTTSSEPEGCSTERSDTDRVNKTITVSRSLGGIASV